MQYTREFSIDNFPFHSGAVDVIKAARKAKKMDELEDAICEHFDGMTPTSTKINDLVWFQGWDILRQLGVDVES